MPKLEKGFALLPVLLLIAAISLAGYFLVSGRNQSREKLSETSSEKVTETSKKEEKVEPKRDFPEAVSGFLSKEEMAKFDAGMEIYKGNNPPNVEGSYQFDSLVVTYDSEDKLVGRDVTADVYRFFDQTPEGRISLSSRSVEEFDENEGRGAYISGEGRCFTVFVELENLSKDCNSSEIEVTSACRTDQGFGQVKRGAFLKKKEGAGCQRFIPAGSVRVATETDFLAESID